MWRGPGVRQMRRSERSPDTRTADVRLHTGGVELFVNPVSGAASAEQVLRRLAARAQRLGLPPPAALTGDWFGGSSVLVPSLSATASSDPFTQLDNMPGVTGPPGAVGGGYIGYLGY